MLKKFLAVFLIVWLAAIFYVSVAHAEVKVTEGAAFRLRQEIWDDVVDFDTLGKPDRNFFRLRTSVWGRVDFDPSFGIYLRLTNEAKYFGTGPFRFKAAGNRDSFDPDELIFDNLYADAKDLFGLPLDLRIGRQDFLGPNMYGEGFLLMDGTPGDGSRSFYFNAAKATLKFDKQNSVDFVYIDDPSTDTFLPSVHPAITNPPLYVDNKKLLDASREQAFMAYGRIKAVDNVTLEPYYIYKIENSFSATPKLKLSTVGGRIVYAMDGGWNVGGEYAYQWGNYDDGTKRRGNGGYVFVGRKYDAVSLKPEFDLRFVYLSGDQASTTDKNETWDPLFSRNPSWSELLIYSLPNEQSKNGGPIPGYWTNMEIAKATIKLNFDPSTNLALSYQYIWAPERPASGLTTAMFGTGKTRGHLPIAILSHAFSKNVDGFLELEYFIPGSFYSDAAQNDNATFFRWQLQVKI